MTIEAHDKAAAASRAEPRVCLGVVAGAARRARRGADQELHRRARRRSPRYGPLEDESGERQFTLAAWSARAKGDG